MQTVKALKALPGRAEGAVFDVDEASATVLKERGDVEFVKESAASGGVFTRTGTGRGNLAVTQVAPADYPEQATGTGAAPDTTAPATADAAVTEAPPAPVEVTKASNKADLVRYALGRLNHDDGRPYTEAEVEELSKPDLVGKLGL
ncbi:hypothetical protein [Mycobacterium phage Weirdo19]|uniref:Uncharacterized protein n=1 Tax=Mycobacterium phage Weirdo19 TaxID=2601610 RepID=A0A6M2YST1_9CAUD|nr:hypothetical protein KDJ11_gp13 [Mycobacterium phage Weirdo19]QEA10781.1 hypothetical protein [Mycobacterium phage Weirdo19]